MRRPLALLQLGLGLLLSGCAGTGPRPRPDDSAAIERRIDEILDAAVKKDFDRLDGCHAFGPRFTKFSSGTGGREDAEAARKAEHDGLRGLDGVTLEARDLKIDRFGDTAVATFLMDAGFTVATNPVHRLARGTLVLVRQDAQWKITHEHFSRYDVGVTAAGVAVPVPPDRLEIVMHNITPDGAESIAVEAGYARKKD